MRFGCSLSPGPPVVLSGTNSGLSPPLAGSSVVLSKSITPSNRPDVRMKSLSARRFWSCSGKPCAAFDDPRAVVTVAPMMRICGVLARMRPTTSLAVGHLLHGGVTVRLKSLIPSSQIMCRDAGKVDHVALDARRRRRPAGKRLVRGRTPPVQRSGCRRCRH